MAKSSNQRFSASGSSIQQRQASPSGKSVAARPQEKTSGGAKVINPDPLARPAEDPEGFKFSDWLRSWRESQEHN
ncbi:hypothetical protein H7347_01025 [Corynebacterium sp. zg-331]|uniref:hypothetical protein n=1 Tax=unclassified Corynebacterium TaxID=2624378 RepID=UPI00128E298F|nr:MULTISPECIES: hypothetical protein [unclassified Corynebacterium]MBC3185168.1 hypothetical protein [Corynebacterium sp. zg-331]MPV51666.1 hypothetical protein [Corynebacterium sp. zg331]